jgi:leucyl/phenylalanyl-tRNA--protein transferase
VSDDQLVWLTSSDPPDAFPDVERALTEPDGLLAAGGDLSKPRLLAAYRAGIFPWYEEGQPSLWWSPDPRCILRPAELHVSKRLRQYVRASHATLSFNRAFGRVIRACAGNRESQQGTWISAEMTQAYEELHADGWAHSVEIWHDDELVGGLYGLCIGKVFFGESMFSAKSNSSKLALIGLVHHMLAHDIEIIDCQVVSPHLTSLGATGIPRDEFTRILRSACKSKAKHTNWPPELMAVSELLRN